MGDFYLFWTLGPSSELAVLCGSEGSCKVVLGNPVTRVSDMSGGRVDHKQTPSSLPTLASL